MAADPNQADRVLAAEVFRVQRERGEEAAKKAIEAVLEGLSPASKFSVRERYPGQNLWRGDLLKFAWPLWTTYRNAGRERLHDDLLRQGLESQGLSRVDDLLGRCVENGIVERDGEYWRINSALMGPLLGTPPLLCP